MGTGTSWRVLAAVIVLAGGAAFAGWAGATGMEGTAVLATFAAVGAFFGMLAWPTATSTVLVGLLATVVLSAGAHTEAVGLILYTVGVAGVSAVAARRRAESRTPPRPHLTLVKGV